MLKICLILQILCTGSFLTASEQNIAEDFKNDLRNYEKIVESFENPYFEQLVVYSSVGVITLASAFSVSYWGIEPLRRSGINLFIDYYDWSFSCKDYAFDEFDQPIPQEEASILCQDQTRRISLVLLTLYPGMKLNKIGSFLVTQSMKLGFPLGKGLAYLIKEFRKYYHKDNMRRSSIELITQLESSYNEKDDKAAFLREHFRLILLLENESLIKSWLSRYMGLKVIDSKIALTELLHANEIDPEMGESHKHTELDECPVCFDEYSELRKAKLLACGHVYCETCLKKCKASCPECRKLTTDKSVDLSDLLKEEF